MARMYSRKRGKSRSKKPSVAAQWVEYKGEEVEKLILKLAKDRNSSARIGLILRDQYGIPSVKHVTEKTVLRIMRENNVAPKIPEDLMNLLKKSVTLSNHMRTHKKDATSKRGLE